MIGGINVPEDDFKPYVEAAKTVESPTVPTEVTGGEVAALGSEPGSDSASSSGGKGSPSTSSGTPAATTSSKPGAAGSLRAGLGFAAAAFGAALLVV
jgi:hypothetical protein